MKIIKSLLIGLVATVGIYNIAMGQSTYPIDDVVQIGAGKVNTENKCEVDVKITFPLMVEDVTPITDIGDFKAVNNDFVTKGAGSSTYDIKYVLAGQMGPQDLDIIIKPGTACFKGQFDGTCELSNKGGSKYSTIDCTQEATNANCSGQPGTVYNSATDTCEISPAGATNAAATCSPKEDETKGERCIDGKVICVPAPGVCCGISLNTTVPFIGKCIQMLSAAEKKILQDKNLRNTSTTTMQVTGDTAFPALMLGLTKILVTVILLASFIAIIVAGVMMAASGDKEEGYTNGTKIIGSVIAALALLGASGVILRLINPNFFG